MGVRTSYFQLLKALVEFIQDPGIVCAAPWRIREAWRIFVLETLPPKLAEAHELAHSPGFLKILEACCYLQDFCRYAEVAELLRSAARVEYGDYLDGQPVPDDLPLGVYTRVEHMSIELGVLSLEVKV